MIRDHLPRLAEMLRALSNKGQNGFPPDPAPPPSTDEEKGALGQPLLEPSD